jgi:3-oxoadipate enol-lactonase
MTTPIYLREFVLERKGCPLHYWLAGKQDAPTLIFTHGATVDHRQFFDQLPVLLDNWQVLLWDMRGHGKSRPMAIPFSVPEAVDDLLAIMEQAGVMRAIFAGQSTGTYVSQEMEFQHPQRVEAIIIIDGTCITMPMSSTDKMILKLSPMLLTMYPFETLKRMTAQACATDPDVQDYVYEAMSAIGKDDVIRIMTGVSQCVHDEPGYRITKPLLLVHGEHDKLGNIASIASRWAHRDPHSVYEVIPDARHNANQDNPEYFNRVMLKFLEQIAA